MMRIFTIDANVIRFVVDGLGKASSIRPNANAMPAKDPSRTMPLTRVGALSIG